MKKDSSALVVGASSGVGKALCYELAKSYEHIYMIAREERDLETISKDLEIQFGINTHFESYDLNSSTHETSSRLVKNCIDKMGSLHSVFLISGANDEKDAIPLPGSSFDRMIHINFNGPAQILNQLASSVEKTNLQNISLCSTIAVPVPRKRNTAYASAKGAMESFAKGIRHALAPQNVSVQIVRLGYVATNLSYGQKLLFPVSSPESVAKSLLQNRNKNCGLRYFPNFWTLIVLALRMLPWGIYKNLKF